MTEKYVVAHIQQTCDFYPAQWEGLTGKGKHIYIRYRCGTLTCGVGETIELAVRDTLFTLEVGIMDIDEETPFSDGAMSQPQMMRFTEDIFDWSIVQSPEYRRKHD